MTDGPEECETRLSAWLEQAKDGNAVISLKALVVVEADVPAQAARMFSYRASRAGPNAVSELDHANRRQC